ncbi:hypothetical protein E3N88_13844 [Mikania micrantha]|uniref:Uncharacterized protein n=1 Tax=Mikania micrantha TaxID=192012 RepID=A0A5N6NZR7_9ASTR|nr:hypothetical protein E3N88_13844 [Mikania micrantha]
MFYCTNCLPIKKLDTKPIGDKSPARYQFEKDYRSFLVTGSSTSLNSRHLRRESKATVGVGTLKTTNETWREDNKGLLKPSIEIDGSYRYKTS